MTLPLDLVEPNWEIIYERFNGQEIIPITDAVNQAQVFVGLNQLGRFSCSLSRAKLAEYGYNDIPLDSIIEFRYKRGIVRTFSFFKRKTIRNKDTLFIAGYGPNHLLRRRNTGAWYAGSSQTTKDDYLDDMMREIVLENCYTDAQTDRDGNADTLRDFSQINDFSFSLAPEASAAPQYQHSFHGENVFEVLTELAQISARAGTRLFFNVERNGNAFEFRAYTTSQGVDRRGLMNFGEQHGNVSNAETTLDHEQEENYIFVAGQGSGSARVYEVVQDDDAATLSALNRMEGFRDARQTADAELTQVGYAELEARKAIKLFRGQLLDTEGTRYGVDWDLGDLLSAQDEDEQFSIMVTGVNFSLQGGGQQSITGHFQVIEDA